MQRNKLRFIGIAFLAIILSCKKTATPIPVGISAQINGDSWIASTDSATIEKYLILTTTFYDSTLTIDGSVDAGARIILKINYPITINSAIMLGLYPNPNTNGSSAQYTYGNTGTFYSAYGTLTITKLTATNVVGNFSLKTYGDSIIVRNGQFNISLSR